MSPVKLPDLQGSSSQVSSTSGSAARAEEDGRMSGVAAGYGSQMGSTIGSSLGSSLGGTFSSTRVGFLSNRSSGMQSGQSADGVQEKKPPGFQLPSFYSIQADKKPERRLPDWGRWKDKIRLSQDP